MSENINGENNTKKRHSCERLYIPYIYKDLFYLPIANSL